MSTLLCIWMHFYLVRENARRDKEMEAKGLTLETYTEDMRTVERESGDNATVSLPYCCVPCLMADDVFLLQFFRYTT